MKQNQSTIHPKANGLSRRHFTKGLAALGAAGIAPILSAPATAATLSIDEAVMPRFQGAKDAPVQVAEYYSMTCGHCAAFHNNIFPIVQSKLIDTGIVRFEMRPFPLDGLALRAHALVRSVPQQKFFPLVKILLAQHPVWVRAEDPLAELMKIARLAGVNANDFNTIMRNQELLEAIVKVRQIGVDKWQISSTPSFVINDDEVLSGNMSYEEFAEKISAFGA
jgi:protein-disulfide isomerase